MKALRSLFLIVNLLVMISLACSFSTPAKPTIIATKATSSSNEMDPASTEPAHTSTPSFISGEPTKTPNETITETVETPTLEATGYYSETFDGSLKNYTYINLGKGEENKMSLKTDEGFLVFDLKGKNLWVYVTYNAFTYKDVNIELTAENRGNNRNSVSLLCRYNDAVGWYEFNIVNNGRYYIYAYDALGVIHKGYNKIAEGISMAVKQGLNVNTYNASCVGEELSLSINGTVIKSVKDSKFHLVNGKVGFNVSSFEATPVLIGIDSFIISEP